MAYSVKNILTQEPTKVTGAIMAIVNVLVVSNALDWNEVTLGSVNTCLVLVLTLFYTAPLTTSKGKLEELQTAQTAAFEAGVQTGTGDGGVTNVTNVNPLPPHAAKTTKVTKKVVKKR